MAVVTIGRLAEEIQRIIVGGNPTIASKVHPAELKLAIGQAANALLKTELLQVNLPTGEMIPDGAMTGLYENVLVEKWQNKSRAKLPITPLKLIRGMGVYSVFPPGDPDSEYIPLQWGQAGLLQSQPLINNLLNQIGYTPVGDGTIVFTRDLTLPNTLVYVSMRLVIMDVSQYGDYDILPLLPEMEFQIKQEVVKMYLGEPVADKLVDPSVKEQRGTPVTQQNQS